jgi:hypothetical protein
MTARLDAYLDLEQDMLALDQAGDSKADQLRDVLDPIWQGLSDDERDFLNRRETPSFCTSRPAGARGAGGETPAVARRDKVNQRIGIPQK